MNDMFSKIDSIDITSIITEQSEEAIQSELNTIYEGSWESNRKQDDNDLLIESIIKEISDSLAITNIKLNKKIVESSISRVYPRFSDSLYKKIIRKLEESGFDVSKLKESDIEDAQKEISDLKQQEEALDKVEDIKTEKDEDEPSKSSINSKLTKAYAKLKSATKDKNDDLDNAFGEEKLTESSDESAAMHIINCHFAGDEAAELAQASEEEQFDKALAYMDGAEYLWYINDFQDSSITEFNSMLDIEIKDLNNLKNENPDKADKIDAVISKFEALRKEDENSIIESESFEGTKADIMKKFPELASNPNYECYADDDWMAVDFNEDGSIKGIRLATKKIDESIAVNATVDNIDQESKDKATIDKAIELAGDKTTIDNDTFRELRLKLANKDYDLVDRTSDYALVRGEDVIYTWTRKEDENLKESESLNEWVNPAPDVKIKDFYAGTENGTKDYQFNEINPNITFQELYDNISKHSITSLIGDVDSDIRNKIINAMCDAFDIDDAYSIEISDDLPPYEGVNESVHVNVSGGNIDVSTDNTNLSIDGDNVDVHVEDGDTLAPVVDITEPVVNEIPIDEPEANPEEVIDEPIEEPEASEEVLDEPVDNILDDSDGSLQVDDIPGKVDHKRIELAKMESEDSVTYRVSYLKEDDEICGWDLDCDNDEDAINSLDQFKNAGQVADDLLTAEFVETGIDGISSFNYNNTDILLSTDGDNNIITINQDNAEPIVMKGNSFDEVLNQLIYWFIMNTDCPDCGAEPAEDLNAEVEIDKEDSNE